jgi:hypothetical protein
VKNNKGIAPYGYHHNMMINVMYRSRKGRMDIIRAMTDHVSGQKTIRHVSFDMIDSAN